MAEGATKNSEPSPARSTIAFRLKVYVFLAVVLVFISFIAFVIQRLNTGGFAARDAQQIADSAAILQPQNYKPAGLYLARLVQSDPALWKSDDDPFPDWLPAELGSVHLRGFMMGVNACSLVWGGGFDDDLGRSGFEIAFDPQSSTSTNAAYVLTYGCAQGSLDGKYPPKTGEYHFTIAKTEHIGEEEFVRRALAELTRRELAYAAGMEVNVYGDDPTLERRQLLAQQPAIAAKLRQAAPALVNGP